MGIQTLPHRQSQTEFILHKVPGGQTRSKLEKVFSKQPGQIGVSEHVTRKYTFPVSKPDPSCAL